jgi:hypothetical protein
MSDAKSKFNDKIKDKTDEEKESTQNRYEAICGIIIAVFAAILALAGLGGNNTGKGQMVAQTEKGSAYEWYNAKSIKQSLVYGQKDMLESLLKSGSLSKDLQKNFEENIIRLTKSAERYGAAGMEILEGSKITALRSIEADAFENQILSKITDQKDKEYLMKFYVKDIKVIKDTENKFYLLKNKVNFLDREKIFDIAVVKTGYKSQSWVQDLNGEYGVLIGANEWSEKSAAIADADSFFDMANLFLQLCIVVGAICIVLKASKLKNVFFVSMIFLGIIGTVYTIIGFIASNGLV